MKKLLVLLFCLGLFGLLIFIKMGTAVVECDKVSNIVYMDIFENLTLPVIKEDLLKEKGTPDDIFVRRDETKPIIDWKTAKYTKNQDKLMPIYEVQLNVYGILCGTKETELYLVYMEPQTGLDIIKEHISGGFGFSMDFNAKVVQLKNDRSIIRQALTTTREIYEMDNVPDGTTGCKDCLNLEGVMDLLNQ